MLCPPPSQGHRGRRIAVAQKSRGSLGSIARLVLKNKTNNKKNYIKFLKMTRLIKLRKTETSLRMDTVDVYL